VCKEDYAWKEDARVFKKECQKSLYITNFRISHHIDPPISLEVCQI